MPRIGRVVLPNDPHQVVQRGHSKQVVFVEDADYHDYLNTLETFKAFYDVQVLSILFDDEPRPLCWPVAGTLRSTRCKPA